MQIVFNMLHAPIHLKLLVFQSHTTELNHVGHSLTLQELNHVGHSLKAAVFGLLTISSIIYAFPILGGRCWNKE